MTIRVERAALKPGDRCTHPAATSGGNVRYVAIGADLFRGRDAYGGQRPIGTGCLAARATTAVLDVAETVTDFAYQPGGGIVMTLGRNVGIRLEGDYRIVRAEGSNSKESRFVAAAVFGFGK